MSHRVCVGSRLYSCGKCCLWPQILVVGHTAFKRCLFVLNQHLCRQPALLMDLQDGIGVLLDNQTRSSGKWLTKQLQWPLAPSRKHGVLLWQQSFTAGLESATPAWSLTSFRAVNTRPPGLRHWPDRSTFFTIKRQTRTAQVTLSVWQLVIQDQWTSQITCPSVLQWTLLVSRSFLSELFSGLSSR